MYSNRILGTGIEVWFETSSFKERIEVERAWERRLMSSGGLRALFRRTVREGSLPGVESFWRLVMGWEDLGRMYCCLF